MEKKLWITTSQGVYCHQSDLPEPQLVMKRKKSLPFFRKGGFGFFGIATWEGLVLVASRENFSKKKFAKHSEDAQIYTINQQTLEVEPLCQIPGIADVHQIATHGDLCFLTDTGHNQVTVFDLKNQRLLTQLVVGPTREDVHHINAVTVEAGVLYVGLNNRGRKDAQVLSLPVKGLQLDQSTNDVFELAETMELKGLTHTHDFEKVSDFWVICASHQGSVYRALPKEKLCEPGKWVRGLAADDDGIWIGLSEKLDRKNRHREDVDGELAFWDLDFSVEKIRLSLKAAGQVNDLLVF